MTTSNEERKKFRYTSAEDLRNNPEDLLGLVNDFKVNQLPRLERLSRYLENDNEGIMDANRRHEQDVADVRMAHGYANYIVTFMQGHMTGNPINITYSTEKAIQAKLDELNKNNKADWRNSLLVRDSSTYGRAYELVYRKEDGTYFRGCDVFNTFVIYDLTVEENRIGGVRFYLHPITGEEVIELYDDLYKTVYHVEGTEANQEDQKAHSFGYVPLHELENNPERMGDFERVTPQIDGYDASQSDTANYMQDFNDAILGIFGRVDFPLDMSETDKLELMDQMRKMRMMMLAPGRNPNGSEGTVDAKYLVKQYDVAGTEAYKKRLQNDIHKFSFTPDLTDEQFAGTQSGKAMEHKLFSLEVIESNKENALVDFLAERYEMMMRVGAVAAENGAFDKEKLEITVVNKVPNSMGDSIENFVALSGELTNETKMMLTKIVNNPTMEQQRLDAEEKEAAKLFDFQKVKEVRPDGNETGAE